MKLSKLCGLVVMLSLIFLTGCSREQWEVIQVNTSDNPEVQHFVNLHIRNEFDEDVRISHVWFEYQDGEEWRCIPLNPNANPDYLIENRALGTTNEDNSLSTTLGFRHYLHPDYPTIGTFRVAVAFTDATGNDLETKHSNLFELAHFTFNN